MIQLNIAMEALTSESVVLISKLANTAGYLDESHLIHAVQRFFRLSAKAGLIVVSGTLQFIKNRYGNQFSSVNMRMDTDFFMSA